MAWKDTLGSNDRQEGRALLAQLERKATYKRNPRFAASSVESGLVDPTTFVAEPAVVSFDDYSPGQYYQVVVESSGCFYANLFFICSKLSRLEM